MKSKQGKKRIHQVITKTVTVKIKVTMPLIPKKVQRFEHCHSQVGATPREDQWLGVSFYGITIQTVVESNRDADALYELGQHGCLMQ